MSVTLKIAILIVILLFLPMQGIHAHHGGLALEGEEGENLDEEATQWQQETLSNGNRVKFLSYPKTPLVGEEVRLVFELQSAKTGFYLSDLPAHLKIENMKKAEQDIAVPPVEGVPGYYEILHRFSQAGNYDLVFRTEIDGKTIVGSFSEVVEPKKLVKDWYVFWGRLVVLLASGVTLMGASLSLKRRLTENPI